MMRGVTVTLPDIARDKLQALQLARDAALDAANAAASRLNNLPRDADQRMRDRLAGERDKQQHRFGQLSRLLSAVQQWLVQVRGVALEVAPSVNIELRNNETLSAAISSARQEIATLRKQLQAVRSAPLPLPDQKQLAVDYVARLVRTGRPTVAVTHDALLKVTPRDTDMLSPEAVMGLVMGLLAWSNPGALCEALEREIDQLPTRADAMPANERMRRVAELEAALDGLERREAALLDHAHANGIDSILPRVDMSPVAFLHVTVTQAKAQVA
jgi:hypothetical protein